MNFWKLDFDFSTWNKMGKKNSVFYTEIIQICFSEFPRKDRLRYDILDQKDEKNPVKVQLNPTEQKE